MLNIVLRVIRGCSSSEMLWMNLWSWVTVLQYRRAVALRTYLQNFVSKFWSYLISLPRKTDEESSSIVR